MKACDFIWQHIASEAKVRPPHCFMTWHAMVEKGAAFNAAAFASFAGLELRHVEAIMAAFIRNGVTPKVDKPKTSCRGHRLPADFSLPDDWKTFARKERGWAGDVIDRIGSQFIDYWHAKSGQTATKLDWFATWRNWVRNSHEPNGTVSASPETGVDKRRYYEDQAARMRRIGRDDAAIDFEKLAARFATDPDGDKIVTLRLVG